MIRGLVMQFEKTWVSVGSLACRGNGPKQVVTGNRRRAGTGYKETTTTDQTHGCGVEVAVGI